MLSQAKPRDAGVNLDMDYVGSLFPGLRALCDKLLLAAPHAAKAISESVLRFRPFILELTVIQQ